MNESSEAAEIMRMLDEVAATFEEGLARSRRFLPVHINMPAEWPKQLLN